MLTQGGFEDSEFVEVDQASKSCAFKEISSELVGIRSCYEVVSRDEGNLGLWMG